MAKKKAAKKTKAKAKPPAKARPKPKPAAKARGFATRPDDPPPPPPPPPPPVVGRPLIIRSGSILSGFGLNTVLPTTSVTQVIDAGTLTPFDLIGQSLSAGVLRVSLSRADGSALGDTGTLLITLLNPPLGAANPLPLDVDYIDDYP